MIDTRLAPADQAVRTPGEAVAAMMLHGLGLAHRSLSLTPRLFANTSLALVLRAGLKAEMCHRFTLGRTLDAA